MLSVPVLIQSYRLIGLKSFLEKNDCSGALEYLGNCASMLNSIEQIVCFQTGNDIADALLSEKQQLIECNNIKILFDGHIPAVGIDPIDMCILLGNPLDNAIEACQKMSDSIQKIISIKTKLVGNMLIMDIFNPVDHDVIILNNTIPTSKEETSNHGFGIYSLQRTLEKYDGIARFKCKNNIFVAEMSLIIS